MLPSAVQAQAAQSAAQGQQMLSSDQSNAANYGSQYNTGVTQANAANDAVNAYTTGMQGAYDPNTGNGNAGSAYTYGLNTQLGQLGYDPTQMAQATTSLNQSLGQQADYSNYMNTGASKWGLNAGGFEAANAAGQAQNNSNVTAATGISNNLLGKYTTAQTGANQFAGQAVQGEENTLGGLQDVFTNAANSRDSALKQMQFYDQLASTQGGLNASNAQAYATAQNQYAAASQALAQATYLASETTGQNLQNQSAQAKLAASAATAQTTANTNATNGQIQTFKNLGMTQANTDGGNGNGQAVYSAQF